MAAFENRHRSLIPHLLLLPPFSFPTVSFVAIAALLSASSSLFVDGHATMFGPSLSSSSLAVNWHRSLCSFLHHHHRSPPSPSLLVAIPSSLKPTTSLIFSLHALHSPVPSPLCSTSSLLSPPSLSLSSSPTSRLFLPSSPSPSSPSSTSPLLGHALREDRGLKPQHPLPWSPSTTLFLLDVLSIGDLGIRKGVQILRHLRMTNPISPLTSFLSLSSVAATMTVGLGPSSIAAFSISSVAAVITSPSTSSLLASVLRRYPPLSVILIVNLPKFLCLTVLPP